MRDVFGIVDMRGRLERANGEERYQSGCSAASGINPLILRKILALTTVASKRRRPKSDCLNVPCIAIG